MIKEKFMQKIKIISFILCFVMAFAAISVSACSGGNGSTVNITYHLNYEGAENREVEIYSGTYAVDWKASRDGFKLDGWYSDAACKNSFNFSERVNKDTDLYAAWNVDDGRAAVTFDYNYAGSRSAVVRSIEKHDTIADKYIPSAVTRLGMKQSGWFKDKEATQQWNFETDTVEADLTLYAGWDHNDNIPRDADGNIMYDNVQVNVWLSGNGQDGENGIYQKLAEQFNKEYAGKIKVNATTELLDQATYSLRSQNTPEKSRHESTYYSVNDIYSMAGIELDYGDWYEGALQDSIYQGAMTSVPMFANVPYLVYNKALVEKYNGNNALPANYTELTALMKKVYDGENNSGLKTIYTNIDWTYQEGAASVAFLQNGAEYYGYEYGMFVNNWSDAQVNNGAVKALETTYNLLSVNGAHHGGNSDTNDYKANEPLELVARGEALFGFVTWAGANWSVKSNLDKVGVMPLSNLFTDDDTQAAKRIPVNTFGLAFYKAKDITLTQLAAAAVFTDYCSKHSYEFTANSWAPVRKSAYDPEKMNAGFKDLVTSFGNPENFYTYAGYLNGKQIYNSVAAQTYLLPLLKATNPDFKKIASDMGAAISAELTN